MWASQRTPEKWPSQVRLLKNKWSLSVVSDPLLLFSHLLLRRFQHQCQWLLLWHPQQLNSYFRSIRGYSELWKRPAEDNKIYWRKSVFPNSTSSDSNFGRDWNQVTVIGIKRRCKSNVYQCQVLFISSFNKEKQIQSRKFILFLKGNNVIFFLSCVCISIISNDTVFIEMQEKAKKESITLRASQLKVTFTDKQKSNYFKKHS